MTYSHVIWDWNGTLLDDVNWCITCINTMLERRGLPLVASVDAYRSIFGFPVIDYYRRAGFDFETEPFELLAAEFIQLYRGLPDQISLTPDAIRILASCRDAEIHQVILSASARTDLLEQVRRFGVEDYFDEILGISDIYAASKLDIGESYLCRVQPESAVLIGDTLHDYEVAQALGVDCVLVADGHQNRETLKVCLAPVVSRLADVAEVLPLGSMPRERT